MSEAAKIGRLQQLVSEAAEKARELVDDLAKQGHAQTGAATTAFQELGALSTRLFDLKNPPTVAQAKATLENLEARCTGQLVELRSHLQRALGIARE